MNYKTLFKRFLPVAYFFATLCVMAGCEQKEDIDADNEDMGIVFNPILDGQQVVVTTPQTRVADIDLKTFGFTVCGYQSKAGKFEDKKTQTSPDVFGQKIGGSFQEVKYNADRNRFLTPERPWMVADEDYLSFFAWSDNGAVGKKGISGHSAAADKGYPTIDISVCDAIVDQPDIVTAQSVDLRNNALISAIDLQFKHILSKISFKGYSSSGASIVINQFDIKYSGYTKSKAKYTFDPTVAAANGYPFTYTAGSEHNTNTSYAVSLNAYPNVTSSNYSPSTAVLFGSMMQIPQETKSGFITAQVKYSIEGVAGVVGPEQIREIAIPEMKLEVGHHYILAFDFTADKVQVSVNSVADWNEMNSERLPLVAGPRGDLLLWLDAGDKPYKFNGDDYWLDRSGYNRHCKIMRTITGGTEIKYEPELKAYKFTNPITSPGVISNYVELPNFGTQMKEITVQLLLKTSVNSNTRTYQCPFVYAYSNKSTQTGLIPGTTMNIPISETSGREFLLNIYEKNTIHFDYTKTGKYTQGQWERTSIPGFTTNQQNEYALLTFRRKTGFKSISRNLSHNLEVTTDILEKASGLEYGYLGGDFDGEIKQLKIYSRVIATNQVESDYEIVKKLHSLPDDPVVPLGTLPTVAPNGLIAYFDANDRPTIYTASNYTSDIVYWCDRTGNGNHLQIFGYNKGISYDATSKSYVFSGTQKDACMKLIKSLGALKEYSVEFYLSNEGVTGGKGDAGSTKAVLVHFTNTDGVTTAEDGFMWYFPDEKNNLWAYANGAVTIFDDAPSSANWQNTWGIGRLPTFDAKGKNFYVSRGDEATPWANIGTYAPKLTHCYIGNNAAKTMPFKGKIKRIRIYNRAISVQERKEMVNEMKSGK